MKEYLFLFRGGLDMDKTPELWYEHTQKWKPWLEELIKNKIRIDGGALAGKSVMIEGANKPMVDGPFVESKEKVGGYLIINANDLNEAAAIAKNCPIYEFEGYVEIREIVVKP